MTIRNSMSRGGKRSSWQVAGVAFGAALLMAASAQADSDFEDGFQFGLGQVLAYQAVQAASAWIYGAPVPVAVAAPVYYAPPVVVAPPVYYAPVVVARPVYYAAPRVVYAAPRYVARPVYYAPYKHGHNGGHGGGQHGGYHNDRYAGNDHRDSRSARGHERNDRDQRGSRGGNQGGDPRYAAR